MKEKVILVMILHAACTVPNDFPKSEDDSTIFGFLILFDDE